MEAEKELRVEALRLAVGRNPKILAPDGQITTTSAEDVAKEADVLFKFLKGN